MFNRLLKKDPECFENLSMNGDFSTFQVSSVRPERRRRTPKEFFNSPLRFRSETCIEKIGRFHRDLTAGEIDQRLHVGRVESDAERIVVIF
jgi:hypothetical protein